MADGKAGNAKMVGPLLLVVLVPGVVRPRGSRTWSGTTNANLGKRRPYGQQHLPWLALHQHRSQPA